MQMIVFCGIQGAGKSTFYREHLWQTHIRLSMDMLKTRHREEILLHACLAAQQPLVIDNTNATSDRRARYLRLAKAAGFRAVLYYFETTVPDALARNATRTGKDRIPDLAIRGTFKRFQLPTPQEGFDELYRVRVVPSGHFTLSPWPDDPQPQHP
ncbi:MAG: AAA family ATPase [Bacillota bacterium]